MHYGLLPRAHRGIFALNELPDLAGRIQVGLFNILQEGDVQIKGYPVRLPIDVAMVFTANPEDYTARGKIITPLKDRIGSEVRTHYPTTLEHGVAITAQEAWTGRGGAVLIPRWVREVVEAVAFAARREKKIDRRSGVSQRLPISALENAVSNAERRALASNEDQVVPRVSDIYAALPSLTGKFELEYEGELLGAENVARELIREAVGEVFSTYLGAADLRQVVRFFEEGGTLRIREGSPAADVLAQLGRVPDVLSRPGAARGRAGLLARAAGGGRRVRARGSLGPEEDRPQRRPRLRGARAASRNGGRHGAARAPAPAQEAGELRPAMAVVRYHRYVGEPWEDLDIDALVDELSDFFLQSGFGGEEPTEFDEDALQALHDAILDAVLKRGLLSPEELERVMGDQDALEQLLQKTVERLMREGFSACERGAAVPRPDGRRRGPARAPGALRAHGEGRRLPRLPRAQGPARLDRQVLVRAPRHPRPRDRRRGLRALAGPGSSATP